MKVLSKKRTSCGAISVCVRVILVPGHFLPLRIEWRIDDDTNRHAEVHVSYDAKSPDSIHEEYEKVMHAIRLRVEEMKASAERDAKFWGDAGHAGMACKYEKDFVSFSKIEQRLGVLDLGEGWRAGG